MGDAALSATLRTSTRDLSFRYHHAQVYEHNGHVLLSRSRAIVKLGVEGRETRPANYSFLAFSVDLYNGKTHCVGCNPVNLPASFVQRPASPRLPVVHSAATLPQRHPAIPIVTLRQLHTFATTANTVRQRLQHPPPPLLPSSSPSPLLRIPSTATAKRHSTGQPSSCCILT